MDYSNSHYCNNESMLNLRHTLFISDNCDKNTRSYYRASSVFDCDTKFKSALLTYSSSEDQDNHFKVYDIEIFSKY